MSLQSAEIETGEVHWGGRCVCRQPPSQARNVYCGNALL